MRRDEPGEDRPPFGTWALWYGGVLLFLLLQIAVFALFTWTYR
jgi:hypothetical protein